MTTIVLSYTDLLDILDDFRANDWECHPCNIDAFAKYVWGKYLPEKEPTSVTIDEI